MEKSFPAVFMPAALFYHSCGTIKCYAVSAAALPGAAASFMVSVRGDSPAG